MIEAGTLCIVYRVDHGCGEKWLGRIFAYDPIQTPHAGLICTICGTRSIVPAGNEPLSWCLQNGRRGAIPARWLKPLPPLDEPVETERETVA